jgi:hypothetical protein
MIFIISLSFLLLKSIQVQAENLLKQPPLPPIAPQEQEPSMLSSPNQTGPIAVVSPAVPLIVNSGSHLTLDGSKSYDPDGDPLTYSWTQTNGPTVKLNGSNTSKATFTAPRVSNDTLIKFKLVVTDKTGLRAFRPETTIVRAATTPQLSPTLLPKPTAKPSPASQTIRSPVIPGFRASGTVYSVLFVPHNEWIATGNWSMIVDNGNLTDFAVHMIWKNGNGTSSHTHQIENFRATSGAGNNNSGIILRPDSRVFLKGFSDVETDGRIVWKNVHTVVGINKGKTISISVDDEETNSHFAGQHIFGIVKSLNVCSDQPLPDMVVLPSCTSP